MKRITRNEVLNNPQKDLKTHKTNKIKRGKELGKEMYLLWRGGS